MKRDPRINAKPVTWGSYLTMFLFMAFVCMAVLAVYIAQTGWPDPTIYFSMVGIVLALSGLGCAVFALLRRRMLRPLRQVSDVAQKVARGDFSVRLAPQRKDGKKDEIELLFEDFNTMTEELGSVQTLKTDFISNVSHEMKTPLAVIQNYAEMMQVSELDDTRRMEYAAIVKESAGKMADLVTNILRLNKLEHQKIVPEAKEYDLCRQLCDCALQFESRWEEKDIELELDVEDSCPIRADESLLELVWNNLLSNAIKFTEPGGSVTLRQRHLGDTVQVSVSDTGCGMSEEAQKHIFDQFYQGDTSHATEGNGLGLALVSRVLSLLGSEIRVESEEGKGSTFTVTLKNDAPKP